MHPDCQMGVFVISLRRGAELTQKLLCYVVKRGVSTIAGETAKGIKLKCLGYVKIIKTYIQSVKVYLQRPQERPISRFPSLST